MLEVNRGGPLLVDVYLADAQVSGWTREVEARRRLVDVLNGADESFELVEASISLATGARHDLPKVLVEKRSILAAIPHETAEQIRLRAVLSAGIGSQTRVPVKVSVLVPPLFLEGTAFVPFGVRVARVSTSLFPRFFPVADVSLDLADGSNIKADVAIVNRDLVAALSQL